jgi:hypothetical protein
MREGQDILLAVYLEVLHGFDGLHDGTSAYFPGAKIFKRGESTRQVTA